jgi:hypothetical protein
MATISLAKPNLPLQSLINEAFDTPKLYGQEGQKLTRKMEEVSQVFRGEPIQRLLKSLEKEYDNRHRIFRQYLDTLVTETQDAGEFEFTRSVLEYAWQVWEILKGYYRINCMYLEIPDACPGHSDNFMLTWSREEHYLECEIFGSGAVEFFYRNRQTGQVWGEDTTVEELKAAFPSTIFGKTILFTW